MIEGQENGETEKIVPICGEAIVVSKRKVKLGELVIRKRRVLKPRRSTWIPKKSKRHSFCKSDSIFKVS